MLRINTLQINAQVVDHSGNDKSDDWILVEENATLIVEDGNRNHTLIDKIRGVGDIAKVLQQVFNNRVG